MSLKSPSTAPRPTDELTFPLPDHPPNLLPRLRLLARPPHLAEKMVLHRRGARSSPKTYARCRERRHNLEDFQVHPQKTNVVDLRLMLHVSSQLPLHSTVHN
jgi:hypothetical protein